MTPWSGRRRNPERTVTLGSDAKYNAAGGGNRSDGNGRASESTKAEARPKTDDANKAGSAYVPIWAVSSVTRNAIGEVPQHFKDRGGCP